MLTAEQIEANKIEFLKLIAEINIEGADTQGLVEWLDSSDFFTAPASTQYHANYKGGLCEHSLNVYKNLVTLYNQYKSMLPYEYDKNSLLVVGLLHDISKTNYYEMYVANKKIYSENGMKHDNMGKFDWFAEEAYKVKDAHDRFVGGTHGFNSMMLVSKYIPLMFEESVAILNHHAGMDDKNATYDLSAILNKYPLATLLHLADMVSCYIYERI